MKSSDRQKLCPNCEGSISVDVVVCPYCTADVSLQNEKESFSKSTMLKNKSLQDSLSSLYNPPYPGKTTEEKKEFKEVTSDQQKNSIASESIQENKEEASGNLWAILSFCAGGIFLTLGLLQFFFSENGKLTLEWNVNHWYIYCLIALPLIFFGFKKVEGSKK